jgi:formylglycine-generating enzyme required for sulfatase activity
MGCEPPARPQWLLVVDTDAALTGQLASRPDLPPLAAIDTLRIDVIGTDGRVSDSRELVVPDARDWPLSFGVVADGRARVRLRAFRGGAAVPDAEGGLLPPPRTTIDRLVVLEEPPEAKEPVGITLSFACLGALPSFVEPGRSCIDAARSDAPASEGIGPPPETTAAGGSSLLAELPCEGEGPNSSVCVPGGFDVIGDARLAGLADTLVLDSAPPLPVFLSPRWMDRYEVTVGEVRALMAQLDAPPPQLHDPNDVDRAYCRWLGADVSDNDAFPVNCVSTVTADAVCALRGGRVPTEAEWEHAARGRGRGDAFPWGKDDPICCTTQAGRANGPCGQNEGPAPVGSHLGPPVCALGDVSRDGVVDLGANLIELTRDAALAYDAPCWQHRGIAFDPGCEVEGMSRVARGGSWNNSLALTHAALRKRFLPSGNSGFRCVYEDAP